MRLVAGGGEVEDVGGGGLRAVGGGEAFADRGAGGNGGQAAAAAAGAWVSRFDGGDVADLAGEAAVASVELVVDDEPAADAGADADIDEVLCVAAGAVLVFSEGAVVGVVVGEHVKAVELA